MIPPDDKETNATAEAASTCTHAQYYSGPEAGERPAAFARPSRSASDVERELLIREYEKLKDEQIQRIGFRDNMIYVTLAVVGAATSFALANSGAAYVLLIVPWISFVLGWTYIANDEKISAIGRYMRRDLAPRMSGGEPQEALCVLRWEIAHRSDKRRRSRKLIQLFVDLVTFVGSGAAAIVGYLSLAEIDWVSGLIVGVEGLLVLFLAIQIAVYSDLTKGR